jgi:hypothetical protein
MIDSKNQMIRSMRSYQEGGSKQCGPDEPNCKKTYGKRSVPSAVKKVGAALVTGTAALVANKKFGLVDKAKKALGIQKKGGAIKRTAKKK